MTTITTWANPGFRGDCVLNLIEALKKYETLHPEKVRLYVNLDNAVVPANRPIVYAKVNQILRALDAWPSDWVLWIDADSMVVNFRFDIDQWLKERHPWTYCITGCDWAGTSGGFLAVRNNEWSRELLRTVNFLGVPAPPYNANLKEQECLSLIRTLSASNMYRFDFAPTTVWSDTSLKTKPTQFVQHVGAVETVEYQNRILAGQIVGGSSHGVEYHDT